MFSSNTSQVSNDATYIEDVFSTYLYTGNGSTQTITNGIDLAGKGGLVWIKSRSVADIHYLWDTARGSKYLSSNTTSAQSLVGGFTFNANGFTDPLGWTAGTTVASWTFRKQPKFFDVVTYTGNGSGTRAISHSLASVPGCVILKRTDTTGNWQVYHQNLTTPNASAANNALLLNDTLAGQNSTAWGSTAPTSTQFTVGSSQNASGGTYVAYLFAHDAGGFGLTGTDNVISCGSFTTDGSGNATVSLGYEPQWILRKRVDAADDWYLLDNMRGMVVDNGAGTGDKYLYPNASYAEFGAYGVDPTSTGFKTTGIGTSSTHIYIAIRRGPMKTPTSGTSVYAGQATADATNGTPSTNRFTAGFPIDLLIQGYRAGGSAAAQLVVDRLRGDAGRFATTSFNAETAYSSLQFSSQTGVWQPSANPADTTFCAWMFRRAPSVFDEVCWTGNGTGVRVYHNLGVAPELIILKSRSQATNWIVRPPGTPNNYMLLNSTTAVAAGAGNYINNPTATYFDTGDNASVNTNAATYVAYLFASCPGVSKVGTYDGSSSDVTVNCGFASGARFVMIRRIYYNGTTPDTGNWWVFDTARGMTSGTDPSLLFNSTASESALSGNYISTTPGGFTVTAGNPETNNANQTYLYLAIA